MSLILYSSVAQEDKNECERMYNKALGLFREKKYDSALKSLAAVKICDPSSRNRADSVIIKVYEDINEQKTLADTAAQRERRQRTIAIRAQKEAVKQRDIAVKALEEANLNLSKALGISAARSLLDKNRLEANVLLSNIKYKSLPFSNEAICSYLRLTPSKLSFTEISKLNTTIDITYNNTLNWIKQCHGKDLVAISDGQFNVWLYSLKQQRPLPLQHLRARSITGICTSNSETFLTSDSGYLMVVDDNYELKKIPMSMDITVDRVKSSQTGQKIVLGNSGGKLYVGANKNNQLDILDTLLEKGFNELDISEDGKVIVATDFGMKLFVWHEENRKADTFDLNVVLKSLGLTPKYLHPYVKLSPEARFASILLQAFDSLQQDKNILILYDLLGKEVKHFLFEENGNSIEGNNYDFTPRGEKIVTATRNAIHVLDTETNKLLWKVNTNSQIYAIDPEGSILYVADGNELNLYSIFSGELIEKIAISKQDIAALLITNDGETIVIGNRNGEIITIKINNLKQHSYIFGKPTVLNKKYAFSSDGNFLLICIPTNFSPIEWSVYLLDIETNELILLDSFPQLPKDIFFDDLKNIVYVFENTILQMDYSDKGLLFSIELDFSVEKAALNVRNNSIVIVGNSKLVEYSLSTGKEVRSFDLYANFVVRDLLLSLKGNKILATGSTLEDGYRIMEFEGTRVVAQKIDVEPLAIQYNSRNQPLCIGKNKIVKFDNQLSVLETKYLETPLPQQTITDIKHNFNGKDYIIFSTRSRNEKMLNMLFLDINTGFTNIILNPDIKAYQENDNAFSCMSISSDYRLKTISFCGLLQIWGTKLFKSEMDAQKQTNLIVIGSAAIPFL